MVLCPGRTSPKRVPPSFSFKARSRHIPLRLRCSCAIPWSYRLRASLVGFENLPFYMYGSTPVTPPCFPFVLFGCIPPLIASYLPLSASLILIFLRSPLRIGLVAVHLSAKFSLTVHFDFLSLTFVNDVDKYFACRLHFCIITSTFLNCPEINTSDRRVFRYHI